MYDADDTQSVGKVTTFSTPLGDPVDQLYAGNMSMAQLGSNIMSHSQAGQEILCIVAGTRGEIMSIYSQYKSLEMMPIYSQYKRLEIMSIYSQYKRLEIMSIYSQYKRFEIIYSQYKWLEIMSMYSQYKRLEIMSIYSQYKRLEIMSMYSQYKRLEIYFIVIISDYVIIYHH